MVVKITRKQIEIETMITAKTCLYDCFKHSKSMHTKTVLVQQLGTCLNGGRGVNPPFKKKILSLEKKIYI